MQRRNFLKSGGLLAGAASLGSSGIAAAAPAAERRSFPQGFLWGSATASYQVEGAVHEDGRGPSIWDTFSHTPGRVNNGDTGDIADDYYHRYREDIALMKALGLKTCRFSVAWSRIFPQGSGAPNSRGLDFYKRMTDELHANGIEPYCTLYHWDLPQALEDRGGWQNPDLPKIFADYCGYMVKGLGSRVSHYMTMNEMRSFVELGYSQGTHAPGLKLDAAKLAQLNHYVVLAHGMAVQSVRAAGGTGTRVGIADNPSATTPVLETPENIKAAESALREENAMFLTVVLEGKYTDAYLARLGAAAPKFTPDEMKTIASPMDFVGLNVYQPTYVRAADTALGYVKVPNPASYPHMASAWLTIGPESLYWVPKLVAEVWHVKELYITENGCSSDDVIAPDGHVYDSDRVMYLRNYLTQLRRGVSEGVPVKGYFLWSLLDNFEWADGYGKRFGITYVDFATQRRTPKLSAEFYRTVIARNALA